jgi:hypothetical protein
MMRQSKILLPLSGSGKKVSCLTTFTDGSNRTDLTRARTSEGLMRPLEPPPPQRPPKELVAPVSELQIPPETCRTGGFGAGAQRSLLAACRVWLRKRGLTCP